MLNNQDSSTTDSADALVDSSLYTALFELSQRHRLKTTLFLLAAMAALTWGFYISDADAIHVESLDDRQNIELAQ